MNRRGVALAEALVALVVGSFLLAALSRLLAAGHRFDFELRRRLAARQAAAAAAAILRGELEGVAAGAGDLVRGTDSALVIRAQRGFGVVCKVPTGGGEFVLDEARFTGARAIDPARDSFNIFLEGDPPWREPEGWLTGAIAGTGSGSCEGGGAGIVIRTAPDADPRLGVIRPGAPVRTFEVQEYRIYLDGSGEWQLGSRGPAAAGGWSATTPLAGPLARRGLRLRYLDAALRPVVPPESAALVEITVRTALRGAGDSVTTLVGVRER